METTLSTIGTSSIDDARERFENLYETRYAIKALQREQERMGAEVRRLESKVTEIEQKERDRMWRKLDNRIYTLFALQITLILLLIAIGIARSVS